MNNGKKALIILVSLIIGIIIIFQQNKSSIPDKNPAETQDAQKIKPAAPETVSDEISKVETKTTDTITSNKNINKTKQNDAKEKDKYPKKENAMNPEDQPRKFFVQDFTGLPQMPDGYSAENIILTDTGFKLKPAESDKIEEARYGYLYSPPIQMDFPSNAVSPLWKEDLPEGTSILVEVCMSPDNSTWGIWHQIMVDDDSYGQINEIYPDGSPNPNYGYIPGGMLFWGERLYPYFKYKITLYSENANSPSLSSVRVYYQDSTLGNGHIAEVNSDNGDDATNPSQQ